MAPPRGRDHESQRGQVLVLAALSFVVLVGFAGLVLDAGHVYLTHRQAQNAADAAALAAAKVLLGSQQTAAPSSANDPAVQAAHDFAYINGFQTVRDTRCDQTVGGQFTTAWYDGPGTPCSASSGFNTRISISVPPQMLTPKCQALPFNCVQVTITQVVSNYLMGVLGQPATSVTAAASAIAQPGASTVTTPMAYAVYLYEPQTGCNALGQQCFAEALAPQRALLSCVGTGNCPTFWVQPGSSPVIEGVDGSLPSVGLDTTALQSNGDVVVQDPTTICDPYNGGLCSANRTTGSKGLALSTGSKLYCSGFDPLSTSNTSPPCTTTGQSSLAIVYGNETGFSGQSWMPTVDESNLPTCGALVLNGDTIANSGGTCTIAAEPYTILPGIYDSIVVNHGIYQFEAGLFVIRGQAPVNKNLTGFANGIDHSLEGPADWDLCTTAPQPPAPPDPAACPSLTSGVWIGHGSLSSVIGSTSSSCGGGIVQGGGGDATQVTGNGVIFRFEGSNSGFVATHEVTNIALTAPGLGAQPRTKGIPLLFDLENSAFIHLDAATGAPNSSFKGIIYQNPSAKGGGLEINPGLGNGNSSINGQVLAYSLTTFGSAGTAVDFSKGLGAAAQPIIIGTRHREPEILVSVDLQDAGGGKSRLIVQYRDEWAMDAYDAYIVINSGAPRFFSQGIWNPAPAPGAPLPPQNNNPGDLKTNAAYPVASQDNAPGGPYYTKTTTGGKPDWTMTYNNGDGTTSTFEVVGDWAWGHEKDIAGATEKQQDGNLATLIYIFPTPPGSTVNVTMFMTDGDKCGDYATATWTLNNVGQLSAGTQPTGTVRLEQ